MRAPVSLFVGTLLTATIVSTTPAVAEEPPLAPLRGELTVLAFWASWCAPCAEELPQLEPLRRHLAGDARVRLVAISVDGDDTRAGADEQWAETGARLPLVHDGAALLSRLLPGVREPTLPLVMVLDRRDRGFWRAGLHRTGARALLRDVDAALARLRAHAAPPPGWSRR